MGVGGTPLGRGTLVPIMRRGRKKSQLASAAVTNLRNAIGCGRRRLLCVINSVDVISSTGLSSERSSTTK